MKQINNIFIGKRFFMLLWVVIALFCISFAFKPLFLISVFLTFAVFSLLLLDLLWIYSKWVMVQALRKTSQLLSLNDDNHVEIVIRNLSNRKWTVEVIDELPFQLQNRDFLLKCSLAAYENKVLKYVIKPLSRGVYDFGNINLFIQSPLKLIQRRIVVETQHSVPVYPSIIQMKKFELYTFSKISSLYGIKKMRRIGHSYEFEQIRNYVRGDDVRQINWKSTARNQKLMINQHEDEKSQPIYHVIDKSRTMLLPFEGLSLLDYSINSALVTSNVALKKSDKVGLLTFSDVIGTAIKAERKVGQLNQLLEALYNQKERNLEANYELMYHSVNRLVKTRSLLFLYTNFESTYSMKRVLPILKRLNKQHLLVVIFFENTAILDMSNKEAIDLKGIYTQIVAEQTIHEKKIIVNELHNAGIQTVYTRPQDLSLQTLNKYLELKSRGLI